MAKVNCRIVDGFRFWVAGANASMDTKMTEAREHVKKMKAKEEEQAKQRAEDEKSLIQQRQEHEDEDDDELWEVNEDAASEGDEGSDGGGGGGGDDDSDYGEDEEVNENIDHQDKEEEEEEEEEVEDEWNPDEQENQDKIDRASGILNTMPEAEESDEDVEMDDVDPGMGFATTTSNPKEEEEEEENAEEYGDGDGDRLFDVKKHKREIERAHVMQASLVAKKQQQRQRELSVAAEMTAEISVPDGCKPKGVKYWNKLLGMLSMGWYVAHRPGKMDERAKMEFDKMMCGSEREAIWNSMSKADRTKSLKSWISSSGTRGSQAVSTSVAMANACNARDTLRGRINELWNDMILPRLNWMSSDSEKCVSAFLAASLSLHITQTNVRNATCLLTGTKIVMRNVVIEPNTTDDAGMSRVSLPMCVSGTCALYAWSMLCNMEKLLFMAFDCKISSLLKLTEKNRAVKINNLSASLDKCENILYRMFS